MIASLFACKNGENEKDGTAPRLHARADSVEVSLTTVDTVVLELTLNARELRGHIAAHGFKKGIAGPDCRDAMAAHALIGRVVQAILESADPQRTDARLSKIRSLADAMVHSQWQGECRLSDPAEQEVMKDRFDEAAWKRMMDIDFIAADKREHDLITACDEAKDNALR
jgi:hypothetical protein